MELKNIKKNKKYLLAVSGGIDSMVMATLFLNENIEFAIAHCNFNLRENEAELDEALVINWCKKNKIDFFIHSENTKEYAEKNKLSIQVAARKIRYDFFNEIINSNHFDFIATAHHQDDTIETTLFHFFRGTGIQGLTGIPTHSKNIIRPLLHVSKNDIIDFALKYNITYRNDSSNFKQDYTRNKLRLSIIPALQEIFPNFNNNIANNIERLQETNEIYQQQITQYKNKLIEKRGTDFFIPLLKLKKANPIRSILFEILKSFEFSYEQTLQAILLIESQSGTYIENNTYRLLKDRNFFILSKKNNLQSEIILIEENTKEIVNADFKISINTHSHKNYLIKKDTSIIGIDASLLHFPLILRKWKQGDYLYPFGMNKKKKVSKVLIDSKISMNEKEHIWVLESNKKIIWIVGLKPDNRFRIEEKTISIIECFVEKKSN